MKIGVLDSGIGGLCIIPEILDFGDVIYFADELNAPFGNKAHSDLLRICKTDIDTLFSLGADIVVIMCNTLSTVCREIYCNKQKVFAIEPPVFVKSTEKTALICTLATSKSSKIVNSCIQNGIDVYPQQNLASIIESKYFDEDFLKEYLSTSLKYLVNYQRVILGCTHYSLIKPLFQYVFQTEFSDGKDGLLKRIGSIFSPINGRASIEVRTSTKSNLHKYYDVINRLLKS